MKHGSSSRYTLIRNRVSFFNREWSCLKTAFHGLLLLTAWPEWSSTWNAFSGRWISRGEALRDHVAGHRRVFGMDCQCCWRMTLLEAEVDNTSRGRLIEPSCAVDSHINSRRCRLTLVVFPFVHKLCMSCESPSSHGLCRLKAAYDGISLTNDIIKISISRDSLMRGQRLSQEESFGRWGRQC